MSATMGDMPGMAMPAGHDMKSVGDNTDNKVPPKSDGMKSMPMKHDMPMGHDMKNMSKDGDMKSMPMKPAMKSMPMKKDMPMNMDDMPGMKGMK